MGDSLLTSNWSCLDTVKKFNKNVYVITCLHGMHRQVYNYDYISSNEWFQSKGNDLHCIP